MEIDTTAISYLALGDSYTIGQAVDQNMRWPIQLAKKLKENNIIIEPVNIIAQTGWTTSNLIQSIYDMEPDQHDLVSLLIGVNNQYQGQPFDVFQTEFDSLLNISIQLAGNIKRVFVVSIPDYGVTPFGANNAEQIAQELDMYNEYMQQACIALEIPFVNITNLSRQLGDSPGALAVDNLHPSGSQYTQWVNLILPVVIDML
ncbi:MAG: SGNH/GDSL hydrolase family protein [Bacteroidetes bacterium]|nr:MAG: SGNH/GDSL hydrolase family protein [Bacteroidota bacterium]